MEFTTTHDYPAGLERLWSVFGQPAYPRRKYLALGATALRLDRFDVDAQAIEVDLERVIPLAAAGLPAWARPLLGSEQTLRHRTTWRRESPDRIEARLEIVPVGLPVRAQGRGRLVEQPDGTSRMTLSWRVDSSLPVLGVRVERLFADQVRRALEDDHRFTVAALRRRGERSAR